MKDGRAEKRSMALLASYAAESLLSLKQIQNYELHPKFESFLKLS